MPCLLLALQVQPHAMAAQARAAADQAEAHLDATAVRAVAQRASAENSTLQAAQRTEASAVCRAVAELWQMEARWHHLGLPKELAATELMTELKDDPPLPGTSPLGTKGMMAAEVAKQQNNKCGKLLAFLPEATREFAARKAHQGRRVSRSTRRLSMMPRGTGTNPVESEEEMDKRDTLTQIPLLAAAHARRHD